MAFIFKPGLWRSSDTNPPSGETIGSGNMFWLPLPVLSFPVSAEWKGSTVEARLSNGAEGVRGSKRKSRVESFSGLVARDQMGDDGDPVLGDSNMFGLFESLVEFMTFGNTEAERDKPMELFWYFDDSIETGPTYRKHKGVYAASLRTDIGDQNRVTFPWNLQLIITDPTIYTTGPGA